MKIFNNCKKKYYGPDVIRMSFGRPKAYKNHCALKFLYHSYKLV